MYIEKLMMIISFTHKSVLEAATGLAYADNFKRGFLNPWNLPQYPL